MIDYGSYGKSKTESSLFTGVKLNFVQKLRLMRKRPRSNPRLDLFADTVHNNSFINFCKEKEKKQMKKLQRPIEL